MDIVKAVLPKVKGIHNIFTAGKNVCIMGAFVTAAVINQLLGTGEGETEE